MKALVTLSMAYSTLWLMGCNSPSQPPRHPMPPRQDHRKPPSKDPKTHLSNTGVLCIQRSTTKEITLTLFPLASRCASSSRYTHHNHRIIVLPTGAALQIETFGSYIQNSSPMATADCGGAGTLSKTFQLHSTAPMSFSWGDTHVGTLPTALSETVCYHKKGGKVKGVERF